MSSRDRLTRALIGQNQPNKPPGPVHLGFTAVAVVVSVCLYYDWWPSRYGSLGWADPLLVGAAAVLVLLICGVVWAIRTLHVVGEDRRWSWWIAPAPVVVLTAVAAVVLLPRPSFVDTRPQFEHLARELLAGSEQSRHHVEIGRFDLSSVSRDRDGAVYFVEDGGLGLTVFTGWAYSPHGAPAGFDDFTATHLGGPWYEFTAIWRS
ncbi:DUF1109 domain-containing protein [Rhodococcus aetherivorans]|uniref:DUF1109 domain-containing protein n=1 Tax=Rhodococcus aetherivorans TaxID=191292 RepID=UPI00163B52E9|nr:DUF1109 domain-containing protein [Rhodococcus aetherivorans]MBC2592407.1 DUF1109 domain-containing protein [Rhodococcus aetherivorans]